MRKLIAGTAMVGLMVLGGAGAAVAGEVNGRGDPTPIAAPPEGRFVAGSICAFWAWMTAPRAVLAPCRA